MANPKVNILIANYNYNQWILDAFDSAINQTYPDVSITIVDDGSTDDSWHTVYKRIFQSRQHNKVLPSKFDIRTCDYDHNGKRIKITAARLDKNYGPSFSRNIGINLTWQESDYYTILDADDVMYPNKVWRLLEEAVKLPINGIVYGDYVTENTETGLQRTEFKHSFNIGRLQNECIIHSGSLISKSALEFAGKNGEYYDNSLRVCEDYDLWLRITRRFSAVHVPECLTMVRVTPHNSSNTVNQEVWHHCMQRLRQKQHE